MPCWVVSLNDFLELHPSKLKKSDEIGSLRFLLAAIETIIFLLFLGKGAL